MDPARAAQQDEVLHWREWRDLLLGLDDNPLALYFGQARQRRLRGLAARSRPALIAGLLLALGGGQLLAWAMRQIPFQAKLDLFEQALQGFSLAVILALVAWFIFGVYELAADLFSALGGLERQRGPMCIDELLCLSRLEPREVIAGLLYVYVTPLLQRFGLLLLGSCLATALVGVARPYQNWELEAQMRQMTSSYRASGSTTGGGNAAAYFGIALDKLVLPGADGWDMQERLASLHFLMPAWATTLLGGALALLPNALWALLGAVCSALAYLALAGGSAVGRLGGLAGVSAALVYIGSLAPAEISLHNYNPELKSPLLLAITLLIGLAVLLLLLRAGLRYLLRAPGLGLWLAVAGPLLWIGGMLCILAFGWRMGMADHPALGGLLSLPLSLGRAFQLWQPESSVIFSTASWNNRGPALDASSYVILTSRLLLQLLLVPLLLSQAYASVQRRLRATYSAGG